jgi:cytochrome c peroxidase
VTCHAVAGDSNEMFSDFQNHVIAGPQIAPVFGPGSGNVVFDGAGEDEDYGLERTTGLEEDRYKFRTAPLRNLARSPAFFHNGAFTDLEDAIRHHLDVVTSLAGYDPATAGVAADLAEGPAVDTALLDPLLDQGLGLTAVEISNLVTFVRDALTDAKSAPGPQCSAIPTRLPSGAELEDFQGCPGGP